MTSPAPIDTDAIRAELLRAVAERDAILNDILAGVPEHAERPALADVALATFIALVIACILAAHAMGLL